MNELRQCLVSCKDTKFGDDGIGHEVTLQRKARFHRFADDWTYAEDQKIPFTTAIVEFEGGKVEKVDPNRLRFTE